MLGSIDWMDFILAEKLGKSLGEIRELPNDEIVGWRAFFFYRNEMSRLHNG